MKKFWLENSGYVILMVVYLVITVVFLLWVFQPVDKNGDHQTALGAIGELLIYSSLYLIVSGFYSVGFIVAAKKDKKRKKLFLWSAFITSWPFILLLIGVMS